MSKIYVITREEGSYSDYRMDVVKAVATEQSAKDFIESAYRFEKIKLDKEPEIRSFMVEWHKTNLPPARPNVKADTEEYKRWQELGNVFISKARKEQESYTDQIVNANIGAYKDWSVELPIGDDIVYSYLEMEVEA